MTAAPDPGPSPPRRGSFAATGAIRACGADARPETREEKSQRATIAIRVLKRPTPSLVSAATCDLSTSLVTSRAERFLSSALRMISLI